VADDNWSLRHWSMATIAGMECTTVLKLCHHNLMVWVDNGQFVYGPCVTLLHY